MAPISFNMQKAAHISNNGLNWFAEINRDIAVCGILV